MKQLIKLDRPQIHVAHQSEVLQLRKALATLQVEINEMKKNINNTSAGLNLCGKTSLTECAINNFCEFIKEIGHYIHIEDNRVGCSSKEDMEVPMGANTILLND